MRVWAPVFNLIAVFVLVIYAAYYLNVSIVMDKDFDQMRYRYAVEQATEASFRKALKTEDINLDYSDMAYVSVDCSNSLDIFDRVMCLNYNMSPSKENFDEVNQSLSCCVMAGFDGYYMTQAVPDNLVDDGNPIDGFKIRFSPKIPYIINKNGTAYAIDTYKKTYLSMSNTDKTKSPYLYTTGKDLPVGITQDDLSKAINTQIRNSIVNEVANSENVSLKDLNDFRLYFPDKQTVTGVNPFDVPSIFVIMSSGRYASPHKISAMSVSGFKVIPKINVITFTDKRTNESYYCYESQLKDEEKTAASGGISLGSGYGDFEIENYYKSINDACKAKSKITGKYFKPYSDIMARKITKKVATEK